MKALRNSLWMFLGVVFFAGVLCVWAYPPDNAAVLYYKATTLYEVDDDTAAMLADFLAGDIKPNDKIREFVSKNRRVIDTVLDAGQVKNCDWGLDYSEGLNMKMSPLATLKNMGRLVCADARILAADGNYEEAFGRCMSLYKTARHINDRVIVSYLVGISVNGMTHHCVTQILGQTPPDVQRLTRLKNQFAAIDQVPLSVKPGLWGERDAVLSTLTPEQMPDVILAYMEDIEEFQSIKEKILSFDKAMIERNQQYVKEWFANFVAAFDMPYAEGRAVIEGLVDKVQKDVKDGPDAIFMYVFMPAVGKIHSLSTRIETHNNAMKTALEVYLIKAKTGKLPDALPAGLAGDLFSGKPFVYEKTTNGFVLRCQGKDLDKNEIYSYEFKVK